MNRVWVYHDPGELRRCRLRGGRGTGMGSGDWHIGLSAGGSQEGCNAYVLGTTIRPATSPPPPERLWSLRH